MGMAVVVGGKVGGFSSLSHPQSILGAYQDLLRWYATFSID